MGNARWYYLQTVSLRGYCYYWTDPLATQIQSHLRIHILLYNIAPPILQWNKSIKRQIMPHH